MYSLSFSADGKSLASGSAIILNLWDVKSANLKNTIVVRGMLATCTGVFSPKRELLALAGGEEGLQLRNLANEKNLQLNANLFAEGKLQFSGDGEMIASGGRCRNEVKVWYVGTGNNLAVLRGYSQFGVVAMSFGPDGKTLSSVDALRGIKVWDLKTVREIPIQVDSANQVRNTNLIGKLKSQDSVERRSAANDLHLARFFLNRPCGGPWKIRK